MQIHRKAKVTLTPIELQHDDVLMFTLLNGSVVKIELLETGANITDTTLDTLGVEQRAATTIYQFWASLKINGDHHRLEREVGTQRSFYEPWEAAGVRIWLDAVDAIFDFMNETHSRCRLQSNCSHGLPPRRHARLVVQDVTSRICPQTLHPWCPLPENSLKIEDCYRGEDCWLGAYDGASAHGRLDINHSAGTPLYAPIDFDDQFLYNRTADGHNNNRWRGVRHWPDGSVWVLTTCHIVCLIVPEHQSLSRGTHYAEAAGVWVGEAEHTHFAFDIFEHGELIHLDPWILFWQMYEDQNNPVS